MAATDVEPTRLEKAKEEAKKIVDEMESNDLAMVISFSDRARVVSNYTGNRDLLTQRIDAIKPTEATTSLRDALAGRRRPGQPVEAGRRGGRGRRRSSRPSCMIYTDGGFPDVEGFSLGNLEPEVVVIGTAAPRRPRTPTPRPRAEARAEAALEQRGDPRPPDPAERGEARRLPGLRPGPQLPGRGRRDRGPALQARPRQARRARARSIDAIALKIATQGDQSFKFDLPDTGAAELEVRLDVKDDLPLDNRAFTLIGHPRKAQVLVVTAGQSLPGRHPPDPAGRRPGRRRSSISPDDYKTDAYKRDVAAGRYDLVIYDRVRPETPPEANALYFGALPPGPAYEKSQDGREPDDPRRQRLAPADAVHPRPLGRPDPARRRSSSRRPARRS